MQAIKVLAFIVVFALCLPGCRFHNEADPVAVEGKHPIFYVKKPLPALKPPTNPYAFVPGSDIYMRESVSPTAREVNITGILTNEVGAVGAPVPSFDGKRVVFAMRCTKESSARCSADTTWNIWTYDIVTRQLEPVVQDFGVRNLGEDTSPAFLPGGKIVFASTRQQATRDRLGYGYVDKTQQTPASVLHVMNEDGSGIEQISFNQSHDLNPSVMSNGQILYARWDHVGERSNISIYKANPDGSDMQVYYGAHSPGDIFLYPRELEDKRLISSVMALPGAWEGGALLTIDAQHFSDAGSPAPGVSVNALASGQRAASLHNIPLDNQLSRGGRFTSPFPVLDGSGNVLVSYSLYANIATKESEPNSVLSVSQEPAPVYGVYVLNVANKSLRPIVMPQSGYAYTNPVAAIPRAEPPIIKPHTPVFGGAGSEGVIHIKSVYDTDQLGRMGMEVLTASERSTTPIPQVQVSAFQDSREWVADIATLKDPLKTVAKQRPARFLRVIKAQPSPPGLLREVIGETNYEMRELVGYAPIEPDGSVKIKVPADVPLVLSVLDEKGRSFEQHTSWIQVRPGETLTCNGCHSPGRTPALNSVPIAGQHPNTALRTSSGMAFSFAEQGEETMAETRTRLEPSALELSRDIVFEDVWTDQNIRPADAAFAYRYADLQTAAPTSGVINFPEHIQPIFTRERSGPTGSGRCDSCHNGVTHFSNNPSGLDLSGSTAGVNGRTRAYDGLLVGALVFDADGQPVYEDVLGSNEIRRDIALVKPGYARGSYLVQKIFNEDLNAERGLPERGLDHSTMLSDAEKKLIVEWIDVGAQYYNSPIDEFGNLRAVGAVVDLQTFVSLIHPSLYEVCGECHLTTTNTGAPNARFVGSRFIMTGDKDTDFIVVSSLLRVENPANSLLLSIPSSPTLHPKKPLGDVYLPTNSSLYTSLLNWIGSGVSAPQAMTFATPYSRLNP